MSLELPIVDARNEYIGKLVSFSKDTLADDDLIEMVRSSRHRYRHLFLTQFEETTGSTRSWVKHLIADPTRLMFSICTKDGYPIGHLGVLYLDHPESELNNLMRAREGGDKQLMHWGEMALLRWLFTDQKLTGLTATVLTTNPRAIEFHCRCGFKVVQTLPLVRWEQGGVVRLQPCVDGMVQGEPVDTGLVVMRLTAEEFLGK